ncbi:MAG: PilZ domain-containing protein [Alphaproteobacteria bacterium]|nr:PilZ domain-containing protein [Alphaproteobacteria bacterium]
MARGDRIVGYLRPNRRRDKRRAMACQIFAGPRRLKAVTKDISMGGFAAVGPLPGVGLGNMIPVELESPGGSWIRLQATVVRNAQDFAVAFDGLTPQAFRDIERLMSAPLRAFERSRPLVPAPAEA